jgi:hypothetical protein
MSADRELVAPWEAARPWRMRALRAVLAFTAS